MIYRSWKEIQSDVEQRIADEIESLKKEREPDLVWRTQARIEALEWVVSIAPRRLPPDPVGDDASLY